MGSVIHSFWWAPAESLPRVPTSEWLVLSLQFFSLNPSSSSPSYRSMYPPPSPSLASSHRSIIIILWHTISKWKTKSLQLQQNARRAGDGGMMYPLRRQKFVIFWHVHNQQRIFSLQSSPQGIITLLSLSFLSLLPTQFFPPYFCSSSFRMDNTIGLAELFCLFCF